MEFEAIRGVRLVTTETCLKLTRDISSVHSNISLGSHGFMKSIRRKTCVSVGMLTGTYCRYAYWYILSVHTMYLKPSVGLVLGFSLHLS
jgi:hypothetical protein